MCCRERKMTHVARKAPPPPVCGFMIWCGEHFEQNCSSCHWRRLTALSAALHPMCIICRHTIVCFYWRRCRQTMALLCYSRELAALDELYLHCSFFFSMLCVHGVKSKAERRGIALSSFLLYARYSFCIIYNCYAAAMEVSRLLFTLVAFSGSYPRAVIQLLLNQCHESIAELRLGGANKQFGHLLRSVSKQRCDHPS